MNYRELESTMVAPRPCPGVTEGARRATGVSPGAANPEVPRIVSPDPEVPEKKPRRKYTAQYKLRILQEADACTEPGQMGALLRREGLYSSNLTTRKRKGKKGFFMPCLLKNEAEKPKRETLLPQKWPSSRKTMSDSRRNSSRPRPLLRFKKKSQRSWGSLKTSPNKERPTHERGPEPKSWYRDKGRL